MLTCFTCSWIWHHPHKRQRKQNHTLRFAELMPETAIKSINVLGNTLITAEFTNISGHSNYLNGLITSMQIVTVMLQQDRLPVRKQASNQQFKQNRL